MKKCTRCKRTKELSEFYKYKGKETYVAACKSCTIKKSAKFYRDNVRKPVPPIKKIDGEIWKEIEGEKGFYEVSNKGRIKSHKIGKTTILKPFPSPDGYRLIDINRKTIAVHRLVMNAFVPNTHNKPQINHINGIKSDNRVENLEWCTASENQLHAHKIGLSKAKRGAENKQSKPVIQMSESGEHIKTWESILQVKRELGYCDSAIVRCCKNKLTRYKSFKWRYQNEYV